MKITFLATCFTLASLNAFCQADATQNYINSYKELAISEEMRTGVPASITLAQGILETQSGQSDLVKASNNHFGIKCKANWTGATVYHDDDQKGECFRSYNSAEESYKDHSDFLKNRPNYAFLFQLDETDYEGWAKGLKKAGYATSSVYSQNLLRLITNYHLQDFTLMAIQREQNGNSNQPILASVTEVAGDNEEATETTVIPEPSRNQPVVAKAAQTLIQAPTSLYPEGVFEINAAKVVYAPAGTSLFALASNYKISYPKLLEFNDMDSKEILEKNELIFLSKKQKKGTQPFHTVTFNETLQDISQTEGIRLESLTEYNHLEKNSQPRVGEKLYLQAIAPAAPKLLAAK